MLKKTLRKQAEEVLNRFQDRKIYAYSSGANCFGLESLGQKQFRGNGILVLTEKELFFEMLLPKKEFNIPIRNIVKIETPKSHLHKTKFKPLLKVIFKNDKGELDSVAWLIKDVFQWKENLEKVIPHNY